MVNIFKEKDYKAPPTDQPSLDDIFLGIEGLQSDFGNVIEAAKKFPVRSTLTVIGFITVLYIGFKVGRKFVKI